MIDLQQVQIAKPCPADWNAMTGTAETRFCSHCKKAVHDLSQMTTAQAQALLDRTNLNACVRITRTSDGQIVTRDAAFTSKKGRKARGPVQQVKPRTLKSHVMPRRFAIGISGPPPPPPPTHTMGAPLPAPPPQQTVTAHEVHAEAMQSAKMGQPYAVNPK